MNGRKEASDFKRKYHLKAINSATLYDVLVEQGYTVVEFNSIQNGNDVTALLEALSLEEEISRSRCFTYQNDKYRLVFVHEDLNDEERTIVLAHEEGHIWNGHMTKGNVFGSDIVQEYEANEFAHHLLKDKTGQRKQKRMMAVASTVAVVIICISGIWLKQSRDQAVYTENYYRTETGGRYHVEGCMYIKDKTDVYRLTREEFDSGEYEPCSACMSNER